MKGWALALPLLFAAAPALAQEEGDGDFSFVLARPPSTGECRIQIAAWVDFTDVIASGSPLRERCVAIDGYWHRNRFYATRTDADQGVRRPWSAIRKRRIGIYADWEALGPYPKDLAQRVTVVGIMGECKQLRTTGGMALGYCHENSGPFIRVAQMIRE